MHPALKGALIGLGIGVFLYLFEYMAIRRAASERARKMAKKFEILQEERSRLNGMMKFCLFCPVGAALIYWLLS
ncbi:MAG TPA: hypothetical protein VIF38_07005 [Burkholderiales bacterium]|jgi:hypothetical protein